MNGDARNTLARIVEVTPSAVRDRLRAQLPTLRIVDRLTTMLDFQVSGPMMDRVDLPDGPLDVEAVVVTRDGVYAGEILVWMDHGYLSGMEYASVTADYPASWPSDDSVVVGR